MFRSVIYRNYFLSESIMNIQNTLSSWKWDFKNLKKIIFSKETNQHVFQPIHVYGRKDAKKTRICKCAMRYQIIAKIFVFKSMPGDHWSQKSLNFNINPIASVFLKYSIYKKFLTVPTYWIGRTFYSLQGILNIKTYKNAATSHFQSSKFENSANWHWLPETLIQLNQTDPNEQIFSIF